MGIIRNPVLRGFNPDPSFLRVGDDYYLATSTFEFHPAVRLHHSTDLVHWSVVGHALEDGFDLRGVPDSGGVWAPSLSYADGEFWLAYSIVRSMDGDDKDIDNYLVTAPSIQGPWSAPVHLGSRGFDFSFFHDPDGTHWIVGVQWDQRPEYPSFGGLVVERYLPDSRRTSGEAHLIYQEDGLVEGPNLYRIGDWYYLLIAAGGTGWNHAITLARSRSLLGPYERDPVPAVLTTRDAPGEPLQKAGHGELVQTPAGDWMLAHLASRPTLHLGERYSTLGRETSLQKVVFDPDGWLRLAHGGHHAALEVAVDLPEGRAGGERDGFADGFSSDELDSRRWSTLRASLEGGGGPREPGRVASAAGRPFPGIRLRPVDDSHPSGGASHHRRGRHRRRAAEPSRVRRPRRLVRPAGLDLAATHLGRTARPSPAGRSAKRRGDFPLRAGRRPLGSAPTPRVPGRPRAPFRRRPSRR